MTTLRARALLATALAAVAAGGCTCTDPNAGDGGTPPDQICLALAKAQCDYAIRCGTGFLASFGPFTALSQQRPNDVVSTTERTQCEAFVRGEKSCQLLAAGLDAGRSTYSAAAFDACLADVFPPDTCARDLNRAVGTCLSFSFAQPATPAGGSCATEGECIGGFCEGASVGAGENTCGTCVALKDGGACRSSEECEPTGYYCGGPADAGQCLPRKGPTDVCDITRLDECGDGLVCAFSGTPPLATPRCAIAKLEGQSCIVNRLECARTQLPPELVCGVVPDDGGTPAPKCVKLFAPVGGSCNTGDGLPLPGFLSTPICPETQQCDTAWNVCVGRQAVGQLCADHAQCAAGSRCLGPTDAGTCTAYSAQSEGCGTDSDCLNLLTCRGTGGLCRSQWLMLGGEQCTASRPTATSTRPCAEGFCELSATSEDTCVARKADGANCSASEECASDFCDGTCQSACWR